MKRVASERTFDGEKVYRSKNSSDNDIGESEYDIAKVGVMKRQHRRALQRSQPLRIDDPPRGILLDPEQEYVIEEKYSSSSR